MNKQLYRNTWLWTILFGLACSILAYGVHWQRGPHHDDYFLYSWSFLKLVHYISSEVRPVGKLFATIVFSQNEIYGRLIGAAMLVGTSLLSGLLIYRLVRIRLAAVSVILLCLVPFLGIEATTWTNAIVHFIPAGFFALLALNLFLSALRTKDSSHHKRLLAILSGTMLSLAFGSIEPAVNFYILFLGILLVEIYQHPENARQMLMSLAWATLAIIILGAITYAIFYIDANQVIRRGNMEIPSLDRVSDFLMGFYRRGIGGTFGQEIIRISYQEGWTALLTNRVATIIACSSIAIAFAFNLFWEPETIQIGQKRALLGKIGILMSTCLLAMFATLLLPAVLLTNEPGSSRLLYLPGICLTLFIGLGIALGVTSFRQKASQRIILAVVTLGVLFLSLHSLGYTRMYQLRYEYDQRQLSALIQAVPQESIANDEITFMPFEVYENFVGYPVKRNPKFILIGGFSSPNSIGTILKQAYPKTRVNVIRPGYGNLKWGIRLLDSQTLLLSGYPVDPQREVSPSGVIFFRYNQNNTVDLVEIIEFTDERGAVIDTVTLPWAVKLRKDNSTRTFTLQHPAG